MDTHLERIEVPEVEELQPRFLLGRIIFAEEIDPKIKAEVKQELVRGEAARFKDFLDVLAIGEIGVSPRIAKTGQICPSDLAVRSEGPSNPQERTWANLAPDLMKRMK